MGGGGSAPSPDKNIGRAALENAQTGRDMLAWMKDQAAVTNDWAEQDRAYDLEVFRPRQRQMVDDAFSWDNSDRRAERRSSARADVALEGAMAIDSNRRQAMAMGVDPRSGRFANSEAKMRTATALGQAGASNLADRAVDAEAYSRQANAINMGSGFAVNPATSMSLSNQAGQAGFGGAMRGTESMGNLLNADYRNRLSQYNANQSSSAGLWGGIGSAIGMMAPVIMSSKDAKTDKEPAGDNLAALEDIPVERWRYREETGMSPEKHVGPYAEDFQRETGLGDGKTIAVQDMVGVTMGAVKELAAKVERIEDFQRKRAA